MQATILFVNLFVSVFCGDIFTVECGRVICSVSPETERSVSCAVHHVKKWWRGAVIREGVRVGNNFILLTPIRWCRMQLTYYLLTSIVWRSRSWIWFEHVQSVKCFVFGIGLYPSSCAITTAIYVIRLMITLLTVRLMWGCFN